jgi:hypothetical protein
VGDQPKAVMMVVVVVVVVLQGLARAKVGGLARA